MCSSDASAVAYRLSPDRLVYFTMRLVVREAQQTKALQEKRAEVSVKVSSHFEFISHFAEQHNYFAREAKISRPVGRR
jgi:hypothetical protein